MEVALGDGVRDGEPASAGVHYADSLGSVRKRYGQPPQDALAHDGLRRCPRTGSENRIREQGSCRQEVG